MRKYTDTFGEEYDLDDPATYKHLPQGTPEVLARLYREIGYARLYVIAHRFDESECGRAQIARIEKLVANAAESFGGNMWNKSAIYWQERLFLFLDEIENMC